MAAGQWATSVGLMLRIFYLVAGFFCLFNGGWMLVFPLSWYENFPASIPHTGPFNSHFVRDLGVAFLVVALAFGWSARNIDRAYPVHLALTVFFTGHALIHLADIVAGRLLFLLLTAYCLLLHDALRRRATVEFSPAF